MIRLFNVFVPATVLVLLLSEILITLGCYVLAIAISADYEVQYFIVDDGGWARIALIIALIVFGLYFHDLYSEFRLRSRIVLFQQLCLVMGFTFIAQALISYVNHDWVLPKMLMIQGSGFALVALFIWRILFSSALWKAFGTQKILFLGSSPVVFEVGAHLLEKPQMGLQPLGYLDETERATEDMEQPQESRLERLGSIGDLTAVVEALRPHRVVVGMKERRHLLPVTELLELQFSGVRTEEIASLYETAFGKICAREIRPSQLIFTSEIGPHNRTPQFQWLVSFVLAFIVMVISLPVMAVVALLVRFTSPGPVLFRQTRVGYRNKLFTIYKFRSMSQDAEARTGAVWATRNDPRITPLGLWLRKLRLDELPQLFNVLRGDMAIVGPRPERPEFVKTLSEKIPYYRQRHCVLPGITGWAQINYKYGDTIEDTIVKLEYDLYYIKHAAFSLDAYIMFHTAKTMLMSRGAQ